MPSSTVWCVRFVHTARSEADAANRARPPQTALRALLRQDHQFETARVRAEELGDGPIDVGA
jgi:hypothetical protein